MDPDPHVDPAGLERVELLRGLAPEDMALAARRARFRRLPKGARLFNQGDREVRAHVLIAGAVRITQSGPDGAQVLIRFIRAGELFGAVSIFTDGRYPGDATAASEVAEANWTQAELLGVIHGRPQIGVNLIRIIGLRLQDAQNRIRELSTQPAEQRVANALLRLGRQAGAGAGEATTILLPLRRQDVADLSGTSLYTASRILRAWETRGWLRTANATITLLRPLAIGAVAQSEEGWRPR